MVREIKRSPIQMLHRLNTSFHKSVDTKERTKCQNPSKFSNILIINGTATTHPNNKQNNPLSTTEFHFNPLGIEFQLTFTSYFYHHH